MRRGIELSNILVSVEFTFIAPAFPDTPWKQIKFLSFQMLQQTVEVTILTMPNLLLQSQSFANDSKSLPICTPIIWDTSSHTFLATDDAQIPSQCRISKCSHLSSVFSLNYP
jgi:hypothetical protein